MNKYNSPVFIVGCGRSGTTLLRLILNRHPNIAIPEETWYYPSLDRIKSSILLEEYWRTQISDFIIKRTRKHFTDLDKEEILQELLSIKKSNWSAIVSVVNRIFAKKEGKQRWGDKTPGYVLHMQLIKELFPDAKIIHIIRDGRDVVPSILKYWDVGPQTDSFIETVEYWNLHVGKGIKDGPRIFNSNYREIRYEDLVSDPEKITKSICDFISERYQPEMIKIERNSDKYVPEWKWHLNVKNKINKDRIGLWKQNLTKYEQSIMFILSGRLLKDLGYEVMPVIHFKGFLDSLIHLSLKHYNKIKLFIKLALYRFYKNKLQSVLKK